MPSPLVQVGNNNTYIATNDSGLVIEFSRNPNEFALPNYVQIRPVSRQRGVYLRIDAREASRIVGGNLNDFVWPDGQARPKPRNNGQEFNFQPYQTIRRNFGQPVGNIAKEEADWDVMDTQEAIQAQKAMTARTRLVHDALSVQANWDATNWSNVASIPGAGLWDGALSTNQFIKRSINHGVNVIMKATNSKVKRSDLVLVINPDLANIISTTQEIIDFIKQSPEAAIVQRGEGRWANWGLPERLYGVKLMVEETTITTTPKGAATQTTDFVMPYTSAYLLARVGGIAARGGGPSFTTCTLLAKEEMTIERKQQQYDRYEDIDVVDDVGVALTAPASGFAFRAVAS
jgi:hypothetical protein